MKLPIWFSAALVTASVATATTKPQNTSHGLSPAEERVVSQARAGEIADLNKKFPEEKDRKLTAHFVEKSLTVALPGFKPHRKGVRIIGAIVGEPIDASDDEDRTGKQNEFRTDFPFTFQIASDQKIAWIGETEL